MLPVPLFMRYCVCCTVALLASMIVLEMFAQNFITCSGHPDSYYVSNAAIPYGKCICFKQCNDLCARSIMFYLVLTL